MMSGDPGSPDPINVMSGEAANGAAKGASDGASDVVCDASALNALAVDIGTDGVSELVMVFISETRQRLQRMATPACDAIQLTREAHTLKGGARTVGASHLGELAAAVELRPSTGGTIGAEELAALSAAFDAYMAEARHVVDLEAATA